MAEMRQDKNFALELDAADELAGRRELFYIRPGQIYMDGNSLGLCSKPAEKAVLRALDDWKTHGIGIWTGAETDYFLYFESIGAKLARLINARPEEVTVCASTTLNIHQCIATFWKPDARRYKIVVDELNFEDAGDGRYPRGADGGRGGSAAALGAVQERAAAGYGGDSGGGARARDHLRL